MNSRKSDRRLYERHEKFYRLAGANYGRVVVAGCQESFQHRGEHHRVVRSPDRDLQKRSRRRGLGCGISLEAALVGESRRTYLYRTPPCDNQGRVGRPNPSCVAETEGC